jgi:5'-3' exonuclease
MQNTFLLLDASNLIYRTFFANIGEEQELTVGLSYQMSFQSLAKFARKYKANDIVMAFDVPNSWRKIYTKDQDNCITRKLYKGQRRQNLTAAEHAKLENLDQHLIELADIFSKQSGVITLKRPFLEADDLIAGFVQKYKDDKHYIISSDKDFIQLLSNGNVTIIDPLTETPRDLLDWDSDANYFMFEKCIRGDAGDNVQSSYPRLRSNKIKEAYTDEFKRANIMNHKFVIESIGTDGTLVSKEYTTGELFEENQLLMDLTKQPEYIREMMDRAIEHAVNN